MDNGQDCIDFKRVERLLDKFIFLKHEVRAGERENRSGVVFKSSMDRSIKVGMMRLTALGSITLRRDFPRFIHMALDATRRPLSTVLHSSSVIPANFSFSQTMPFSMKKLIFNDFFCRTGIKIPAKPDKKSTKKISKNLASH